MGFVLPDPKEEFTKVTEDNDQRLEILLSLFQLREAVLKKYKKKKTVADKELLSCRPGKRSLGSSACQEDLCKGKTKSKTLMMASKSQRRDPSHLCSGGTRADAVAQLAALEPCAPAEAGTSLHGTCRNSPFPFRGLG